MADSAANASEAAATHRMQFDHHATPAEKAKATLQAAPAGLKTEKRNRGSELVTDTSAGPMVEDLPPPSSASSAKQEHDDVAAALAKQKGGNSIIGWEQTNGGNRAEYWQEDKKEHEAVAESASSDGLAHQTQLETVIPENLYGDWYHNTAAMSFCALSCWIVGRLGGGLAWIVLIGAALATYYRTSIRRVRRNARDDISRILAKRGLEHDFESAEWMNSFLTKFWIIYEPVLSATLVSTVDQVLATSTPAFLESLRLDEFTLGTKPPRIEHVKTYPRTEDDVVVMDWKFAFVPNDIDDLTQKQIRNKVNPRIVLGVRVGKSIATANMPIVVEDIACAGLMQVKIKLMTEFPHIKLVDLSFLEKPLIDYVLKPIGGKTLGIDIGFIPGLSGFILSMIHGTLAPMMYAPNVFTLNIQQLLSGAPIDSAIGVAVITIHSAAGVKNPDKLGGKPDPYVKLSLGSTGLEVGRTAVVQSTNDPLFNETKTVLITTMTDPLVLEVLDFNEIRSDRSMGMVIFPLDKLEEDAEQDHLSETVMYNGKPRGNLNFSISWYPVLTAPKLEDGSLGPVPESKAGIVRFSVHQAKNIAGGKNVSAYANLLMNAKEIAKTPKMKNTHNPVWDFSKEILVTDRDKCVLGVMLKHDELGGSSSLGSMQIKLTDLLKNAAEEVDEYPLQQAREPDGKIRITASWRPVALTGLPQSNSYAPPIGALRVHFHRASDLIDLDVVGKPDPYMQVMVNGSRRARTVTVKNEFNPVWDEIVYVPVRNAREKVRLECMDYQQRTKDRHLGHVELDLAEFMQQASDGSYQTFDDRRPKTSIFRFDHGTAKGQLFFTISFFPALNVYTREEEEQLDKDTVESPVRDSSEQSRPPGSSRNPVIDSLVNEETSRHIRTSSSATTSTRRKIAASKVRIATADLAKHQSGFLVFDIIEGSMAHSGCYLQVYLDDYLYPAYTSAKARSKHTTWNESGDAFVRELDFSQIRLRIQESHAGHEDDENLGEAAEATLNLLRRAFHTPTTIGLRDKNGQVSNVTFKMRFIPVAIELDPAESVNNMGTLRVDLLRGTDLVPMDRGKSSDPYCKFILNGETVYTSETIKKTLNPTWNESFEVQIASRIAADFKLEVFDWDLGGGDDPLGNAIIDLRALEPMLAVPVQLQLRDVKSGVISMRLLFRPGFVTRARRGTTSRTMTIASNVGGAPIKVVGGALSGVKKTSTFIGRGVFGRRSTSEAMHSSQGSTTSMAVMQDGTTAVHDAPAPLNSSGQPVPTSRSRLSSPTMMSVNTMASNAPSLNQTPTQIGEMMGSLTLHLTKGDHFPDCKVAVRVRGARFNEKSSATRGPAPNFDETLRGVVELGETLVLQSKEHSTFATDKTLATAQLYVDEQTLNGSRHIVAFDDGATLELTMQVTPFDSPASRSGSKRGLFHSRRNSTTPSKMRP